ncbi:MAG: nuclear transport factor 2 family protein [Deltaproteobacteria bacterium]|nr:nuclear transport factor 2 family protein [Deltaproteobacteria bacterium]MBW2414648.1 nuclear transport factor 2 family protein [Deltaproteobacteria bacterium]
MDPDQVLKIQAACERLSILYARMADWKQYDLLPEVFTEDASLDVGGRLDGIEKIAKGMSRRPETLRSRHVLTNIFVQVVDADHARGTSYLSLYRHVGEESLEPGAVELAGPAAVGEYEDEFRRTGDGWRISSRVLHLQFRRDSAFPERRP